MEKEAKKREKHVYHVVDPTQPIREFMFEIIKKCLPVKFTMAKLQSETNYEDVTKTLTIMGINIEPKTSRYSRLHIQTVEEIGGIRITYSGYEMYNIYKRYSIKRSIPFKKGKIDLTILRNMFILIEKTKIEAKSLQEEKRRKQEIARKEREQWQNQMFKMEKDLDLPKNVNLQTYYFNREQQEISISFNNLTEKKCKELVDLTRSLAQKWEKGE